MRICSTRSKLACVRGLLNLKDKKYKQAAREFLDVDIVIQQNYAEVRQLAFVVCSPCSLPFPASRARLTGL